MDTFPEGYVSSLSFPTSPEPRFVALLDEKYNMNQDDFLVMGSGINEDPTMHTRNRSMFVLGDFSCVAATFVLSLSERIVLGICFALISASADGWMFRKLLKSRRARI